MTRLVTVVPNVLSPKDLVSKPDNMDKIVLHTPAASHAMFRLQMSRVMRKPDF